MSDTICSYHVTIESPLLIEILNRYGELPDNYDDGFIDEYGVSFLVITEDVLYFSFDEGYANIEHPIQTLDDFMDAFLSAIELDDPPEELEPFNEAQEEIYRRCDEIKNDIIRADCSYSVGAIYPDDDGGLILFEKMPDEDAKRYHGHSGQRITQYSFKTEYSFEDGKDKFNHSYTFDFD